jgi:hypothetical protein
MYKSEKRLVEEIFLPFQLMLTALESLEREDYAAPLKALITKLGAGKDVVKITRRCGRLSYEALYCVEDKQSRKVSGHKFILMLHALAELIIDSGFPLPEEVIKSFEPFFEVESSMDVSEEDWINIRDSAAKTARKVFEKLNQLGYYAAKN